MKKRTRKQEINENNYKDSPSELYSHKVTRLTSSTMKKEPNYQIHTPNVENFLLLKNSEPTLPQLTG